MSCSASTTLDEFSQALLIESEAPSDYLNPAVSSRGQIKGSSHYDQYQRASIANVVIAKNLQLAPEEVQIQALEVR